MINLLNSRVGVTGANSMIGKAVIEVLKKRGAEVIPCYHEKYDLRDSFGSSQFFIHKMDYCIALAGYNGNIDFNKKYPADIFYNTSLINLHTLRGAQIHGVKKLVSVIASCAYPPKESMPEDQLWNGESHSSVKCHGHAKRLLDTFSFCLKKQYGFNSINVILNNSFGPGDNYDLNKTKVVGSLIKKFVEAEKNKQNVELWGRGVEKRELVYCKDAAEGIVQSLERYNEDLPLNIGSGDEYTIKELANKISKFTNFSGKILWDTSKPDGQLRKKLDITRMKKYLDIKFTPFDVALIDTIEDYYKVNND